MKTSPSPPAQRYRPFFWEEFAQAASQEQGTAWATPGLRALRDGLGQEAGTASAMRYLHRVELTDDQRAHPTLPGSYRAEHAALTLFGLHQNAGARPVHRPGVGLGAAVRALSGDVLSSGGAQRRLMAAATAQDLDELVHHLRGLIPLLRQADTGLDYTRLYWDLLSWLTPESGGRVLRAWGLQYTDPAAVNGDGDFGGAPVQPYWRIFDSKLARAGADLAALRSGAGREAGTVPAMWPFYSSRISSEFRSRGVLTRDLTAEHSALALFGLHQQGRTASVHTAGHSPGRACRLLLGKDNGADRTATERRLGALLTAVDAAELAQHLRGLVPLLRRAGIGLDYDALHQALRLWDDPHQPDEQSRIRNRWDRDFHTDTQSLSP